MTLPDDVREEWSPGAGRLSGPAGLLATGIALVWHVVSFQWLRAPGWKNLPDAKQQLHRLCAAHADVPYSVWVERIGREKRIEFTSAAGVWYQSTIEAFWDDAPSGAVRVVVALDDGGRGAYHPLVECLLVPPDQP